MHILAYIFVRIVNLYIIIIIIMSGGNSTGQVEKARKGKAPQVRAERGFKTAAAAAGIPEFHFHSLRHTYA